MKRVTDDSVSQDDSPTEPPPKRMRSSMSTDLISQSTSHHSNVPGEFEQVSEDYLLRTGRNWKIFTNEEMPGAHVFYLPGFIDEATANMWKEELDNLEACG